MLWWKLGGLAALVAALWFGVHHYGATRYDAGEAANEKEWQAKVSEARQERIQHYETEIAAYTVKLTAQEAATAALAGKLTNEQSKTSTLQKALSRAPLVTHEPNTIPGQPDVVRLARSLRVCLNASATGSASEIASCEALGVPLPATP